MALRKSHAGFGRIMTTYCRGSSLSPSLVLGAGKVLAKAGLRLSDVDRVLSRNGGKRLNLELGLGNGEFFHHLVSTNFGQSGFEEPDAGALFIGVELHKKSFLQAARQFYQDGEVQDFEELSYYLYNGDIRDFLLHLSSGCCDSIYCLHPDPWPKRSHYKRRLINFDFVAQISELLVEGGRWIVSTDHKGYAFWIAYILNHQNALTWLNYDTWHRPFEGHIETKYAIKAKMLGNDIFYFICQKVNV